MTVSHWRRAANSPRQLDCDLCIIGAGVCGVAAAIEAQNLGLSTVIVERHTLASGASSRNAGFLMRGAADHYADAIRLYGRPHAALVWRWTEENLALLRAIGIESLPSYRRIPSVLLALNEQQEDELADSARLLREDGFDVDWMKHGTDSAWTLGKARIRAGLVNPNDASINPVDLMRHLASKFTGLTLENHEVFAIEPSSGNSPTTVRTDTATIRARRVLLCTNAYAGLLTPELVGVVMPRRGQMFALRSNAGAPPLRLDASYYANHGSEYFRQTVDGTIVVGGCRTYFAPQEVGYEDRTTDYVQTALESFAHSLLGHDWHITARWSGTMGFSPDGLPLVGPIREDAPNIWFCGGFTGHGMSMGFRTAKLAVNALLSPETPNLFPLRRIRSQPPR